MEAILAIGGVFVGFALLIYLLISEVRREAKEGAEAAAQKARADRQDTIARKSNEINKNIGTLTPAQRRKLLQDDFTD